MFEENLKLLQQLNPSMAMMTQIHQMAPMPITQTRCGEANVMFEFRGNNIFLYSNYSAKKELQKWFSGLDLSETDVLMVYGLGLGHSFDAIQSWLEEDPERYLIYFEDEPGIFRTFLEMPHAAKILSHPQVEINIIDETNFEDVCKTIGMYYVNLAFSVEVSKAYNLLKPEVFHALKRTLYYQLNYFNGAYPEFIEALGTPYYRNFFPNVLQMGHSHLGQNLYGNFANVPAIICGAGPSLNKNADILKQLDKRALIMAGGSAISALSSMGVTPHFGGCYDPHPAQHGRIANQTCFELPVFYKPRLNFRALQTLHGPKIYMTGSTAYQVTSWLERQLGICEPNCLEGDNILHALIEMACMMGCSPVIFVGMDLAFTGDRLYSDGVVSRPEDSHEEIIKGKETEKSCIERKDIYGESTFTVAKWIREADFTAGFPAAYPHVDFINSTEGGIGFEGIPNIDLQKVADKHLTQQYDIPQQVHAAVQNSEKIAAKGTDVLKLLKDLNQSLQDCVGIVDKMKKSVLSTIRNLEQGKVNGLGKKKEKINEILTELENNTGYSQMVFPVNVFRRIECFRKLKQEEAKKSQSDAQRMIQEFQVNVEELESHKVAANVSRAVLSVVMKEYQEEGYDSLELDVPDESSTPVKAELKGCYSFSDGVLKIEDPELDIHLEDSFNPVMLPETLEEGVEVSEGHTVKLRYLGTSDPHPYEAYICKEGKPSGQYRCFFPDGSLKGECFYISSEGETLIHGPSTTYSKKGKALARAWYFKGELQGRVNRLYPEGSLCSTARYKDDVLEGKQEYFYKNGKKKTLMPYSKGKVSGLCQLYYQNGILSRELTLKDGVRQGEEKEYYPNGRRSGVRVFQNDMMKEERYWYSNEVLREEKIYHGVVGHADVRRWNLMGTLYEEAVFSGDQFEYRFWSPEEELLKEYYGYWDGEKVMITKVTRGQLRPEEKENLHADCVFEDEVTPV